MNIIIRGHASKEAMDGWHLTRLTDLVVHMAKGAPGGMLAALPGLAGLSTLILATAYRPRSEREKGAE